MKTSTFLTTPELVASIKNTPIGINRIFGLREESFDTNTIEQTKVLIKNAIDTAFARHIPLILHTPDEQVFSLLQSYNNDDSVKIRRSRIFKNLQEVVRAVSELSNGQKLFIPLNAQMLCKNSIENQVAFGRVIEQSKKVCFGIEDAKTWSELKMFDAHMSLCRDGICSVPMHYDNMYECTEPLSPEKLFKLSHLRPVPKTLAIRPPQEYCNQSQTLLLQLQNLLSAETRILLVTNDSRWTTFGTTITPSTFARQKELLDLYTKQAKNKKKVEATA